MTILSGPTNSFKLELAQGIHDMRVGGDDIRAALYSSVADLHAGTTAYSTTNEVTDTNWPAGGQSLVTATGYPKILPGGDTTQARPVVWAFVDSLVANVTLTFRAVLIYNATKANRSMFVIDKGVDVAILAGPITLFSNPANPNLMVIG